MSQETSRIVGHGKVAFWQLRSTVAAVWLSPLDLQLHKSSSATVLRYVERLLSSSSLGASPIPERLTSRSLSAVFPVPDVGRSSA